MTDPRAALVRYYHLLRQHGLNDSHSGNGSVRTGERVWLTPTGACGDTMTAADLIASPVAGPIPAGASLDAALHLAVYRAAPDSGAVLHSHGPHAIACSLAGSEFTPIDFEGRHLFPRVPIVDLPGGDHVREAPERIAAALSQQPFAILRGHGVYARGADLDEAYRWNSQIEASARIAWLARGWEHSQAGRVDAQP